MTKERAATWSPPGAKSWMGLNGDSEVRRRLCSDGPDRPATLALGRAAALLQREAAHLTRRDGHRRRLVDHGDGTTIEEADRVGLRPQPPVFVAALQPTILLG